MAKRLPGAGTRKMGSRKKAESGSIVSSQGPNGSLQSRIYVEVVELNSSTSAAMIPASADRMVAAAAKTCPGPGLRRNRPGMPAQPIPSAAAMAIVAGSHTPCRAENMIVTPRIDYCRHLGQQVNFSPATRDTDPGVPCVSIKNCYSFLDKSGFNDGRRQLI